MKWHIEKKSLIHYSLKKGCKLMHPFLLSVFISCIYFELIFKMKSVDNTSANPRISIAGNAVPKKIAATIVAATGSTLDNNPAYTLPAYFTAARYRQNGKIVPTITIVRNPTTQSYPDVPQFSTVLRIPPARLRRSASPMRILTRPDIS